MGKVIFYYHQKKRIICPILGVLAVSLIGVIYVLLGEGSYVEVHDQLDGEVLNYIYQAKYLFQGNVIPEFMNGMDKASMTPPAPLAVLFYKLLSPFAAFVAVQWLVVLVGFLGMYFLCDYLELPTEICLCAGGLFAYMPFYPTYGLAALGQPLLLLCYLWWLRREKKGAALAGICFYGLMSSLTLVGFVWLVLGGLHFLWLILQRKLKEAGRSAVGIGILLLTYLVTNVDLLRSVLGGGFETHRQEMVLYPIEDLVEKFKELFIQGGSYSKNYAVPVFCVALLLLGVAAIRPNPTIRSRMKRMLGVLAVITVLTVWAVMWNSPVVVGLRESIGGIVAYFQADRVYWIFPFLWSLLGALCLDMARHLQKSYKEYAIKAILCVVCVMQVAFQGAEILRDSTLNKNIRLLLVDDYEQVTWEALYMEDVFEQIEVCISPDKSQYSVLSLGIYPSVALYNGFTCADGYSNNYDVNYKHQFREIMSPELEKDKAVRLYFDQWGNRCYLATAQRGYDAMVKKGSGFEYDKPSYTFMEMERLNVRYLFAAAPVADEVYEKMLVEGSPFSSETSYYEVWVYDLQKR